MLHLAQVFVGLMERKVAMEELILLAVQVVMALMLLSLILVAALALIL
jgi:hypothetical protein